MCYRWNEQCEWFQKQARVSDLFVQKLATFFKNDKNRKDKGLEDQFTKLERHRNTLMDTFDYNSVMLYGNTAFSNTMVARTGVRLYETYDKPGLSASDLKRVRKMYWCDEEWMKKQKKS
ncbi:hypothetical protein AVEN_177464-1 [Araneus ventricosus]|uniref:Peptidase M12A domain-containing protein n=1 Tax=Araneus ventricosus TaxID=182803 RepID=A0A4Y2VY91_ARAVE|nr:hypothetical protein AVEN_177464-1 [Araneus ventricosus]